MHIHDHGVFEDAAFVLVLVYGWCVRVWRASGPSAHAKRSAVGELASAMPLVSVTGAVPE